MKKMHTVYATGGGVFLSSLFFRLVQMTTVIKKRGGEQIIIQHRNAICNKSAALLDNYATYFKREKTF